VSADERISREQVLRAAVLAGDERAWQAWYDETFEPLYGYVLWRSGGWKDRADEVVQECWLTAVRHVRRFDPQRGRFLDWLRGIAANLMRNQVRRESGRRSHEVPSGGGPPGSATDGSPLEDRERGRRIAAALAALPERQEAVLRAKYLEGRSVAEIATAWGQTPKAVESLLARAREQFRTLYARSSEDDERAGDAAARQWELQRQPRRQP
jgi:RNA polymerase sigma-70 factor (ECF subfamily)